MESESLVKPPVSRVLKGGRVVLCPGEEVGQHVTENREELLVVLKGIATLIMEGVSVKIDTGGAHYIEEGVTHNVRNDSDDDLEYVYVVSLF
jgi:mannose-6-phosphate isomerase-like protein (cupin superfamily)